MASSWGSSGVRICRCLGRDRDRIRAGPAALPTRNAARAHTSSRAGRDGCHGQVPTSGTTGTSAVDLPSIQRGIRRMEVEMTTKQNREIGPIGTTARVVGGLIAIALPISLSGFGWWEAGMALVALPLLATGGAALVAFGYQRLAPDAFTRGDAICTGP